MQGTKQKMFRLTERTIDLLKIVATVNKSTETETLELALELLADQNSLDFINKIHGEKVDRKTMRKTRTVKKKAKENSSGVKELDDTSRINSVVAKIAEKNKCNELETDMGNLLDSQKVEIVEIAEPKVEQEQGSMSALTLDAINPKLLDTYGY